jgi:hypothetical protein
MSFKLTKVYKYDVRAIKLLAQADILVSRIRSGRSVVKQIA